LEQHFRATNLPCAVLSLVSDVSKSHPQYTLTLHCGIYVVDMLRFDYYNLYLILVIWHCQ